ncbi:CBS domain-containing protein [Nitrospiraceae bacterium AH_259_D15_M11_P09]|nr:CBS domain-containing protein [Nitrospiraceae bacterium AH_259_D15_M11_P09]
MITISEVMSKEPKKIASSTSVVEAATRMRDERVGSLLVERNGEFVGMVTDTDVVRKAVAEKKDLAKTTVETIMTAPLNSIEATKTVPEAHDMMGDLGVRHLAVREAGKVVGVISVGDLAVYFTWLSEQKIPER